MASTSSSRMLLRSSLAVSQTDGVLAFLLPATQCTRSTRTTPRAYFSTTPTRCKRDNNTRRGLSVMKGTGLRPRQTLSVKQKDFANQKLPKPVPITKEDQAKLVTGSTTHGLWGFFKNQQLLQTPLEEQSHGRAWTVGELRSRDWESLHQLWWMCVKERNRLATATIELQRLDVGSGELENEERDKVVQETMKAILDTLAERQQAYREAYALARKDPTIDLSVTDGPQLLQTPYDPFEDDATVDTPKETPSKVQPEATIDVPAKEKTTTAPA